MDYEGAKFRLKYPVSKSRKKLGHKLYLQEEETGAYTIEYFKTHMLTFWPNESVRIRMGAHTGSQCTRQKINDHLPQDWSLRFHDLAHNRRKYVGVVNISKKVAVPYEEDGIYHRGGKEEIEALNDINANETREKAGFLADTIVAKLLRGEISREVPDPPSYDAFNRALLSRYVDVETHDKFMIQVFNGEIPLTYLLRHIIKTDRSEPNRTYYADQATAFLKEVYPFTGKPSTQKEAIAQLEYLMKNPETIARPAGNTPRFHDFKKKMKEIVEVFLLHRFGFETFDK